MRMATFWLLASVGALSGCAPEEAEVIPSAERAASGTEVVRPFGTEGSLSQSEAESAGGALRVVFLGTSLTEGLGLVDPALEAWPSQVGALARSAGHDVEVVNAGLSGETSAGALRRVDWILRQSPDVLVVETGANDGLRAIPTDDMAANLDAIVSRVRESHPETEIVLVQMEAPPNLGPEYATRFREAFPRVAGDRSVALTPLLLDAVGGVPGLNQADGIHPTAEGHRRMAENAWTTLDSIFRVAAERQSRGQP